MKIDRLRLSNLKSFSDADLSLDQINVLVGRNNSGKSTVIRGVHVIQEGGPEVGPSDLRIGESVANVLISLSDIDKRHFADVPVDKHIRQSHNRGEKILYKAVLAPGLSVELMIDDRPVDRGGKQIPNLEPANFIYSYLSKRKVVNFDRVVNLDKSRRVDIDFRNLVSKVDELANPGHPAYEEYRQLCADLLGFTVTAVSAPEGKQAGIMVGRNDRIYIEAMGEGVSSLLGLITSLCSANGNLFLIEEPENDIHPESLKVLLATIIEKSADNQFIVSTHSNIVTKYLGSRPNSKIFEVTLGDYKAGEVPTSTIRETPRTAVARIDVLRKLGYEVHDLDFWEGWLFLEESSAQAIIEKFLIPWFTEDLGSRIRIVSTGGVTKAKALIDEFWRLFLYAHLEPHYKERAWLLVDGDAIGKKVVEDLRSRYPWPSDHFRNLRESDFEKYFPSRFQKDVDEVLSKPHDEKRAAKIELCRRVVEWCHDSPVEARREFEISAPEVIEILREIEVKIRTGRR